MNCCANLNLQLQLHGVSVYNYNCKLTCASFQGKTVISLSLRLLAPVCHAHLSWVHPLLMLNNLSV